MATVVARSYPAAWKFRSGDSFRIYSSTPKEYNDCWVLAAAIATGSSYDEAHEVMEKAGRVYRHRFSNTKADDALRKLGYNVEWRTPFHHEGPYDVRLGTFARVDPAPDAVKLILVKHHVFCVRQDIVWDRAWDRVDSKARVLQYGVVEKVLDKPKRTC